MTVRDAPAAISVVVPALNEAREIDATLATLQPLRRRGHEVILVDGGSTDETRDRARDHVDRLVDSARGRGRQMNAGAAEALGDVLLFLHADTRLPPDADRAIREGLAASGRSWGRFDLELSGRSPLLRLTGRLISFRSRLTGMATGDQAIFVLRSVFEEIGGYADIPLMEDLELCRRLLRIEKPVCLRQRVTTSSRRWEERGFVRTVLLMWRLRLAYYLGADPRLLAERYR